MPSDRVGAMNAVTLGPAGTYSHRAARAVAAEVSFRESVTAIVDAVAAGEFERGVVPIENSIEGSVTESLDALATTTTSRSPARSSPRSDTPSSRRDRSSRSSPATRRRSRSVATGSKSTTRTRDSKRSRPRLAGSSAPARTPGSPGSGIRTTPATIWKFSPKTSRTAPPTRLASSSWRPSPHGPTPVGRRP